jgi:superfamily I DNA and/or RNA helicase
MSYTTDKRNLKWFLNRLAQSRDDYEFWWEPSYKAPVMNCEGINVEFETCKPDLVVAVKQPNYMNNKILFGLSVDPRDQVVAYEMSQGDTRTKLFIIDLKMAYSVGPYHPEAAYYAWTLTKTIHKLGFENDFVVCSAGILPEAGAGIINTISQDKEDVFIKISNYTSWIDLKPWMNKLNDFFSTTLPVASNKTWDSADWYIGMNRCSACSYLGYPSSPDTPEHNCHRQAMDEKHLELIPGFSRSTIEELIMKGFHNLNDIKGLKLDDLGSKEDYLYKAIYGYGIDKMSGLSKEISDSLDEGRLPLKVEASEHFRSISIPYKDEKLQEYVINVEFDSSSHRLGSIAINRVDDNQTIFYEESLRIGDDILPTAEEEIRILKAVSTLLDSVISDSEQIHFYLWSKRELSFIRELLERYQYTSEHFATLSGLFIVPTHFHSPTLLQSEFTEGSKKVISPFTILDGEMGRAFHLPSLYAYSVLEIGRLLNLSYEHLQTEEYPDMLSILSDAVPAAGVHHNWIVVASGGRSKLKKIVEHKLDILRKCVYHLREMFSFQRNAFYTVELSYNYNYPQNLAKEAHAWLLQSTLNFCEGSQDILRTWQLPVHERIVSGKSAQLSRVSSERWKRIFDQNPDKWARKGFQRDYSHGTFIFSYDMLNSALDVQEGQINWSLAPNGDALSLLEVDIPGGTSTFHARTHPNNGNEYYYELLSCEVVRYRDGFAVVKVWSGDTPTMFRGYPWGKWDNRKKAFWATHCNHVEWCTLEKTATDYLVERLSAALPRVFPADLNIEELIGMLKVYIQQFVKMVGSAREKREIKSALNHLTEDLIQLDNSLKKEHVDYFYNSLSLFISIAEKTTLTDVEKRLVNVIDDTGSRIHLYSHFSVTTPQGTGHLGSSLHTFCAQYLLSPPSNFLNETLDKSAIHLDIDKLSPEFTVSQIEALKRFVDQPVSILWGPPGSGKSHTIRKFIELWAKHFGNQKILFSASNNSAVDSLLEKIPSTVSTLRVSNYREVKASSYFDYSVFATTPQKVWGLYFKSNWKLNAHPIDVIIIDEAGQMPPAQAALVMMAIRNGARVILAGDDLQLPPIHQYVHPEGQEHYVSSVYSFYKNIHKVDPVMLKESFRSHPDIVNFLAKVGYPGFTPINTSDTRKMEFYNDAKTFYDRYFDSACVVILDDDSRSEKLNTVQANEAIEIIKILWETQLKDKNNNPYDLKGLFTEGVAVIAPYRLQYQHIQRQLLEYVQDLCHSAGMDFDEELQEIVSDSVDTVHRFQGSERDVVIVTLPTGEKEKINDKLLLNPHLLNVAISRAKKKIIIFCTKNAYQWTNPSESDHPSLFQHKYILGEFVEYCSEELQVNDTRKIRYLPPYV